MINQIKISKHDLKYIHEKLAQSKGKDPIDYFLDALLETKESIKYHTEEHKKEIERTEGKNGWINELRKSLKDERKETKS